MFHRSNRVMQWTLAGVLALSASGLVSTLVRWTFMAMLALVALMVLRSLFRRRR